jgi:hypothetical protein
MTTQQRIVLVVGSKKMTLLTGTSAIVRLDLSLRHVFITADRTHVSQSFSHIEQCPLLYIPLYQYTLAE